MKKLTSTLGVFALAVGVAGAFAMSPAPKKVEAKSSNSDLYWFRVGDGSYIEEDTQANKQNECGSPQTMDCVNGYLEVDPNTQTPIGSPVTLQGNKQL